MISLIISVVSILIHIWIARWGAGQSPPSSENFQATALTWAFADNVRRNVFCRHNNYKRLRHIDQSRQSGSFELAKAFIVNHELNLCDVVDCKDFLTRVFDDLLFDQTRVIAVGYVEYSNADLDANDGIVV
ncbi:hypothetical protein FTUN_5999 [Frigoriglobus tundricola]|uniref:Uncharacterized protein n=1 Tax=Frigoriglobus tundricola TaxID=2774151 RepID=A0A6M5YWS3_9BACT|nr:hypothetical protein FTUN_5999 [Frigoriglobus tundricola]